jgi:hypothetical protein
VIFNQSYAVLKQCAQFSVSKLHKNNKQISPHDYRFPQFKDMARNDSFLHSVKIKKKLR